MSSNPRTVLAEIRELMLLATVETDPDSNCIARLNKLLAEHPDAASEAAAFLDLQGAFTDVKRYESNATPSTEVGNALATNDRSLLSTAMKRTSCLPAQQDFTPPPHQVTGHKYWLAIAGCILLTHLAIASLAWLGGNSAGKSAKLVIAAADFAIGTSQDQRCVVASRDSFSPQLVSATGCVWDSTSSLRPQIGEDLNNGETLHLREGIAELELDSKDGDQARIRIEGPASIFVRADGQLGLRFGALTADVHWRGTPLTIETPVGRVVVSGDSYVGVLSRGQRNEVHVFSGRARIDSAWSGVDGQIATLAAGEAVALAAKASGDSSVKLMDASYQGFPSVRSMTFDQLDLGEEYAATVQRSKPSVYWRFGAEDSQEPDKDHTKIPSLGGLEGFFTSVVGSVGWSKFGSNSSAEFGLTKRAGTLLSDSRWPSRPLSNYSVELWVKPSHFHNGAVLGLVADPASESSRHGHGFLIELGGPLDFNSEATPPNAIRFLHRSPPSYSGADGTSCCANTSYLTRNWQHVVARKTGALMELVVNGKLVAEAENKTDLPPGMRVLIGKLDPNGFERPFIGQVDEVALYEHALSDKEIEMHYRAGRPKVADPDSI